MVVTALLVLFGVPAIAALLWTAQRRARRLSERIAQVREEMARDPRPPLAALAELMHGQDAGDRGR